MFYLFIIYFAALSTPDPSSLREDFKIQGVDSLQKEEIYEVNDELSDLGRLLYFDKVLSGNKNISCATCHHPTLGTSDGLAVPFGEGGLGLGPERELEEGRLIPRNAPAVFNMIFPSFNVAMWDGRISFVNEQIKSPELNLPKHYEFVKNIKNLSTLQAHFPVTSHDEMRGEKGTNEIADASNNFEAWRLLTQRVLSISEYEEKFKRLFPNTVKFNYSHIASALGAFEMKAFEASDSVFDRFMEGDNRALTYRQLRGADLFLNQGRCVECHKGSHFTDFSFHSISAPQLGPGKEPVSFRSYGEDLGLYLETEVDEDRYKFKTPSLRNVTITGPWLHSGAFNDLYDVIYHHSNPVKSLNNFIVRPENFVERYEFVDSVDKDLWSNNQRTLSKSSVLEAITLSRKEIEDIVEFLQALEDKSFTNRFKIPEEVPSGLPVED